MTSTVLLVEDHELLSTAVAMALRADGLTVESCNPTGDQDLFAKVRAHNPTAIMLDLDCGGSTSRGEELVTTLVDTGSTVVVVTGTEDTSRIATALDRGAAGFVHKSDGLPALIDAVTRVLAGQEPTHMSALRRLRRLAAEGTAEQHRKLERFEQLSTREAAVLHHITEGVTVDQIAKLNHVAVATIRSQVRGILTKLGVNSQIEAVVLAYRSGWASAADPS